MKKICIIGQGGHSKVIEDILLSLKEYEIGAYLDDRFIDTKHQNGTLYGPISLVNQLISNSHFSFIVAIGNNEIRKKIVETLKIPYDRYALLIHRSAIISPTASIGLGTVVMPGAIINADTQVGQHAIINTGVIVEHENRIGNFVHLSPNATLTGNVQVDEGSHIGAGVTIIPNISIGNWCIVGAGATVIRDVGEFKKVAGTPAKSIE
ncbi:acetyltransferase [Peribacillus simplex]|uniref:acetyltransferase n=1 Tax=Peribacillus TaxID=2675229 RepID=UPI0017819E60|nr:acetyltransferase [Brevibacillus sp. JNUCC-41]QOS90282.1 acetyltransferase [Brevibacillus sp. JNUCC-41]